MTHDWLGTARRLAMAAPKKPRQSDLKRAVSTAYYALFHVLAATAADTLVGAGDQRTTPSWIQVYRALEHGFAKAACKEVRNLGFSAALCNCADAFVDLQQARHDADYNPVHRLARADALAAVARAEQAIADLNACSRKERAAFAVHLIIKKRP